MDPEQAESPLTRNVVLGCVVVLAITFGAFFVVSLYREGPPEAPLQACAECGSDVIEGASVIHETCVDHMLEEAHEPAAPDDETTDGP